MAKDGLKILLAEDERSIRLTLNDELEDNGHRVECAADGNEAMRALQRERFDVLISDIRMPGVDGVSLLKWVKENAAETEVIMITGAPTYQLAIDCIKNGAYDFIPKPFNNEEVNVRLTKLNEVLKLRKENRKLREDADRILKFDNLVGSSRQMQEIFDDVRMVSESDIPILLKGESGTGKELFAKAIVANSDRKGKPFITVACHVANENLLESDLFGHLKGAFTGADKDRNGKFVEADGGTLFLDDIDDMPLNAQAKLLRAIQFGHIEPLGWNKPDPLVVNVRVIAATKIELTDLIEDAKFREDLYFRLNTLQIDIPPLRKRPEDIKHLVYHFMKMHANGEDYEIADDALMLLEQYHWPGNVRELEGSVRAAMALSGKNRVLRKELFMRSLKRTQKFNLEGDSAGPLITLSEAVEAAEKSHIERVLKFTEGNTTRAAEILKISRKNLWEKRKKYELND